MLKIGFTGSRDGISEKALIVLHNFLSSISIEEFHHGDCVGADQSLHNIIKSKGIPIFIHPPSDNKLRAFCADAIILTPKNYLQRNKDIVNSSDFLLALPSTNHDIVRSGTWSTIRYARNINKPVLIIYPDGTWSY